MQNTGCKAVIRWNPYSINAHEHELKHDQYGIFDLGTLSSIPWASSHTHELAQALDWSKTWLMSLTVSLTACSRLGTPLWAGQQLDAHSQQCSACSVGSECRLAHVRICRIRRVIGDSRQEAGLGTGFNPADAAQGLGPKTWHRISRQCQQRLLQSMDHTPISGHVYIFIERLDWIQRILHRLYRRPWEQFHYILSNCIKFGKVSQFPLIARTQISTGMYLTVQCQGGRQSGCWIGLIK